MMVEYERPELHANEENKKEYEPEFKDKDAKRKTIM